MDLVKNIKTRFILFGLSIFSLACYDNENSKNSALEKSIVLETNSPKIDKSDNTYIAQSRFNRFQSVANDDREL
ncbi:hypothetical protein SAMN04488116_0579 [Flagellimonas flava]|uniref:Uncharacterized protein n=1 Tax=Flagellimonas flava TaxID=570519 RepID=A0A1M5IAT2_9FLAO|nr:hypothetical protein SAMN04488116_0579 [Allomuricauda flava]